MINKRKYLKNILTTASMLSVLAGGVQTAAAVARETTNAGKNVFSTGVNLNGAAVFASGSTLKVAHAQEVDVDINGVNILALDINGAGGPLNIINNASLGSVLDVAVGGNAVDVLMTAAQTLTLTGTSGAALIGGIAADIYTGFGNVDYAGGASTITINTTSQGAITLAGKFSNTAAATLNVQTDLIATNDVVAQTALAVKNVNIGTAGAARTLTIQQTGGNGGAVTVSGDVRFLNANSVLKLDSTNAGAPAVYTINAGSVQGADDVGIVNLHANARAITVAKAGAETLGQDNTHRLKELLITGNKAVIVDLSAFAKKITLSGIGAGADGLVTFTKAVDMGVDSSAKFTTGTPTLQFNEDTKIETIDFSNQAGTVKIADGMKLTANLVGDTTNVANSNGILTFDGSGELVGTATRLAKINAGENLKTVKLSGAHTVTEIVGKNAAGILELADGFSLTGAINSTAGTASKLQFKGAGTVTGTIGNHAAVGIIEIHGNATKVVDLQSNVKAAKVDFITAGGIVKLGGNYTGTVAFTADGTLLLSDAVHTITGPVTVGATNTGTITADLMTGAKLLKIDGQIGDVGAGNKALKLIEVTGGGDIELTGGTAYIKKINIGTQDATLKLSNAGAYKIEEFAHSDGRGTVEVNAAMTLKEGTILSKSDNKLKNVHFLADNNLTLETGVNVYALTGNVVRTGITANAENNGVLTFTGTHIVDAAFNNTIKEIHATGAANKTLAFNQDVKAALIDVVADGTIQFKGNVTGTHLKAAVVVGGGSGTVEFINTTGVKADIEIGNTNALKFVKISGSDVEFTKVYNAATLEFTNKDVPSTVKFFGDLGANNVTTVSTTERNHNIRVSVDQTITGNIGTLTNPFGNIIMAKDVTTRLGVASKFFGSIATDKKDEGVVMIDKAIDGTANAGKIFGLGNAVNRLKTVTFNENATIDGDTFAKDISVIDGKTATFRGSVTGETLMVGNAANGANAIFADGAHLTTHAKTFTNDKSILDFQGGGLIGKIGASGTRFEEVKFNSAANSAKTVMLTENIYSKDIQFAKSRISVDGNVTLNGYTATGVDTIIDLNKNQLTLETKANLTGNVAINVNVARDNSHGKVIVANGAALDFTAVTSANLGLISIDDDSSIQDRSITVIKAEGTGDIKHSATVKPKLTSTGFGNAFVDWTLSVGANKKDLVLTSKDIAQEAGKKFAADRKMDSTSSEFLDTILDKNSTGQAADLKRDLGRIASKDLAKFEEATNRASNPIQNTNTVISELSSAVTSVVSSRISTVSGTSAVKQVAGDIAGVAAGDESARFGAWGSPFYSQATQSNRKGISGYKAKSAGGTVGFDTMANDTLTVGVAATFARTDVKHKNIKAGDKTKLDTMMFSAYAMQNITENWFAQGIASFGSSKVKNTEKHITSTGNESASGKYDSMSYGFEALGGYNYKVSDAAVVTPIFGLGYTKFNDSGYKQTGTTNRNFTINKKSTDKFEGILGARASVATDMNGIAVTPEVHAFVRQNLSSKSPKVTMLLDGAVKPLSPKAEKPVKTFFNVGTSVMAKSGMMEYGAGYDAHFANKYVGHTGTLKVRVNF